MKTNYIIFLFSIISCKENKVSKNTQEKNNSFENIIKTPNVYEQKSYKDKILNKIKGAQESIYYQPNGGQRVESDSTVVFIEIHEDLNEKFKYTIRELEYIVASLYNNDEYSSKFFLTNKDSIVLAIKTINRNNKIKKDTLFFKNNKVYFWENKKATNKELLAKEKEVLLVKREIDSIMNK
jgi:hypothetical protein